MNFYQGRKSKFYRIVLAVIPALVVFGLVYAADVYYDLDTSKVIMNQTLGIATTSPRYTLDVWGDFSVGTSTDTNTPILYVDTGGGGFVGIATTTPYAALTINESRDFAFGSFNEKVLDDMEASALYWTRAASISTSTESTIVKVGGQSLKFTASSTEDEVIRKRFSANQDLSGYERISFWIYADRFATSTATTTQLLSFSYHDTGGGETTSTISFQKENRWQYQEIVATSTAAGKDAIDYIAFRTDFGNIEDINFYVDQIRAYNQTERAAEMFVDKDGALTITGRGGVELVAPQAGAGTLPGVKVSGAVVELGQPLSVNVGGDVGFDYDINFLNTGLSQITSEGPLRIAGGDANHAENLTITVGGTGDIIAELANASSSFMITQAAYASTTAFIINSETNATSTYLFQAISDVNSDESEKFVIDAAGRVGIGTTTPSAKLEIYNDIAGQTLFRIGTSTASGLMVMDSSGRVGIASSTPSATLGVQGTLSGSGNVNFFGATATTTIGGGLVVGTNTLWAPAGGNVGIGTASPSMLLDIQGATGNQQIKSTTGTNVAYSVYNNTGGNFYIGREQSGGGGLVGTGGLNYAGMLNVQTAHALQFATNNIVRTTIDSSGNVGIGTTTPTGLFTVGTSTAALVIANNGRVGISSTTPSDTFAVQGNIIGSGNISIYGANVTSTFASALQAASVRLTGGASNNYVLTADNNGFGNWQPLNTLAPNSWQYVGPNAIRPTSTVGIIVSASSTFAGDLTVSSGNLFINGTGIHATSSGDIYQYFGSGKNFVIATSSDANIVKIDNNGGVYLANSMYQDIYGSDDGLVLYLPFSEGMTSSSANIAYDRSPYGNDGTATNMPMPSRNATSGESGWSTTTCKVAGCMSFDGVNDKMNVPIALSPPYTLTFWGKLNALPSVLVAQEFFTDGSTANQAAFGYNSTDQLYFNNGSNFFWGTPSTPLIWHMYTVVVNGANSIIYLDGGTPVTGTLANTSITTLKLGENGNGTVRLTGIMDEVRIYNRALTADEIRAHYLRGTNANGAILADKFRIIGTDNNIDFQVVNGTTTIINGLIVDTNTLYVESGGNRVGIATSSPRYTLDVWGDFSVGTSTATNIPILYVDTGTGYGSVGIGTTTPTGLLTVGTSTAALVVGNNGRVGIATSTPSDTFAVQGNIMGSGNIIIYGANVTSTFASALQAANVRLTGGASNNYVLTSDVNGFGNWQSLATLAPNSWQYVGPNAIKPTSTVGIIVSASSTFAGDLTVSSGNLFINGTGIHATSSGDIYQYFGSGKNFVIATSSDANIVKIDNNGGVYLANSMYQDIYGSDDGLVLYLPFSEGMTSSSANIAYDRSPYGNDGTATNMPMPSRNATSGESGWSTTTCKVPGCMSFDGSNDYVNVPIALSPPYTLTLWGKLNILPSVLVAQEFFTDGSTANTAAFGYDGTDRLYFNNGSNFFWGTPSTPLIWHMYTVVVNGANSIIYLDGGTPVTGTLANTSITTLKLGENGNGTVRLTGIMDEVRIYNRALTADEIRAHYLRGTNANGAILADKFRIIGTDNNIDFQSVNGTTTITNGLIVDTNTLYVMADTGYVGIGTAGPVVKLHIKGTAALPSNGGATANGIAIFDGGNSEYMVMGTDPSSPYGGWIQVNNAGTSSTYRPLYLQPNGGNVGIATSSPRYKLDVWGDMAVGTSTGVGVPMNYPLLYVQSGDGGLSNGVGIGTTTVSGTMLTVGTTTPALVVSQNGYVGIGTTTPGNVLTVNSAATSAFVVNSSGQVGIGTVSPEMKLHINDTASVTTFTGDNNQGVRIVGNSTVDNFSLLGFSGVDYSLYPRNLAQIGAKFTASGSYLYFGSSNNYSTGVTNQAMVVDPSGNVGIGTTGPSELLTVFSTTDPTFQIGTGSATTTISGLTTATSTIISGLAVGNNAALVVNQAASANSLYIATNGNIGIGTASPTLKLTIRPSSDTDSFLLAQSNDNVAGYSFFADSAGLFRIRRSVGDGITFTDRLTIDLNGNVGIATTSPRYKLDVWGDMAIGTSTGVAVPQNYPMLYVNTGEGGSFNGVGIGTTTVSGTMLTVGTTTPSLVVANNGNVGIKTITPTATFQVGAGTPNRFSGYSGPYTYIAGGSLTGVLEIDADVYVDANTEFFGTMNLRENLIINVLTLGGTASQNLNVRANYISSDATERSLNLQTLDSAANAWVTALTVAPNSVNPSVYILPTGTGNVGIATSSPRYKLDVWGDMAIGTSTGVTVPQNYPMLYVNTGEGGSFNGVGIGTTTVSGTMLTVGTTTPALVVSQNGNVGIGTTGPIAKLDISNIGSVDDTQVINFGEAADNSFSIEALFNGGGSTGNKLGLRSAWTDNIMVWRGDGNVGIGTTTPERKLVVDGTGFLVHGNNTSGTEYEDWPYASLAIRRSDDYVMNGVTALSIGYRNDPIYSTDNSIFNFRLFDTTQAANAPTSAATTRLEIGGPGPIVLQPTGGYIGIGDTTPDFGLEIGASSTDGYFAISGGTGGSGNGDKFIVDENGNVGIATSSPRYKLDVWGDFAVGTSTGTNVPIFYVDTGSSGVGIGTTTLGTTLLTVGTTTPNLVVANNGNVGIGTRSPSGSLHVAGTVFFPSLTSAGASNNHVCRNGSTGEITGGGSVCDVSSLRFKERIEELSYGLKDVMKFNPVSFYWKPDESSDKEKQIGFIAEDMVKIIPELVDFDDKGPRSIDYSKLTVPLTKSIQEIGERISLTGAPTTTPSIVIDEAGNVGIGTSTPEYKLDVVGAGRFKCASATWSDLGAYIACADIAELYATSENLEPGDLVMLDSSERLHVRKADNSNTMLGIVSTAPGLVMRDSGIQLGSQLVSSEIFIDGTQAPIALSGRVPVKVSAENGPIAIGDYLTSASSTPGFAMRATGPGRVIGMALEPFDGTGTTTPGVDGGTPGVNATGKIMVFVNPHWWGGELSPEGLLVLDDAATSTSSSFLEKVYDLITGIPKLIVNGILEVKNDIITHGAFKGIVTVAKTVVEGRTITIENSVLADDSRLDVESEDGENISLVTYSIMSPRKEIMVSGSGKLLLTPGVDGGTPGVEARIAFHSYFSSVISDTAPIRVVLTPTSPVSGNLYISEKSIYGLTVKEVNSQDEGAEFDWIVIAKLTDVKKAEEVLASTTVIATQEATLAFVSLDEAPAAVCQLGQNQACGTEVGACQIGVQVCENGQWSACMGAVMPTDEILDEVDNNCDGQIDEWLISEVEPPQIDVILGGSTSTDSITGQAATSTLP